MILVRHCTGTVPLEVDSEKCCLSGSSFTRNCMHFNYFPNCVAGLAKMISSLPSSETPPDTRCTWVHSAGGHGGGAFLEYIMHENKRIEQRLWILE
jgi:hypothetical protein